MKHSCSNCGIDLPPMEVVCVKCEILVPLPEPPQLEPNTEEFNLFLRWKAEELYAGIVQNLAMGMSAEEMRSQPEFDGYSPAIDRVHRWHQYYLTLLTPPFGKEGLGSAERALERAKPFFEGNLEEATHALSFFPFWVAASGAAGALREMAASGKDPDEKSIRNGVDSLVEPARTIARAILDSKPAAESQGADSQPSMACPACGRRLLTFETLCTSCKCYLPGMYESNLYVRSEGVPDDVAKMVRELGTEALGQIVTYFARGMTETRMREVVPAQFHAGIPRVARWHGFYLDCVRKGWIQRDHVPCDQDLMRHYFSGSTREAMSAIYYFPKWLEATGGFAMASDFEAVVDKHARTSTVINNGTKKLHELDEPMKSVALAVWKSRGFPVDKSQGSTGCAGVVAIALVSLMVALSFLRVMVG